MQTEKLPENRGNVDISGSEINSHYGEDNALHDGQDGSRESVLAFQLNRFRFKNSKVIKQLLNLFATDQTTVTLQSIPTPLIVPNQQLLEQMKNYFREMDDRNQILPDFTYSSAENDQFIKEHQEEISATKQIGSLNSSSNPIQATQQAHYSYFVSNVSLENYQELIIYMLVQEFLLLNSQSRKNEFLTLDFSHAPEHLGLIDSLYNRLFICIKENNKNDNNSNPKKDLFDVFIMLTYDDNVQQNSKSNTIESSGVFQNKLQQQQNQLQQQFLQQSEKQQQLELNHKANTTKSRFNQAIKPAKYSKLIHRSTQIPMRSIAQLVKVMDSDGDNRLVVQDIEKFSHSKFIFLKPNIYQEMFDDVAKLRSIKSPEQKLLPITAQEIWGAVQMHYKLDNEHKWVENPRPYRQYWVQFLNEAGENIPLHHDLPVLKIEAVRDMHQFDYTQPEHASRTQLLHNKANSQPIIIQDIPKKSFIKPFRPEGGVVINNTEYIREIGEDEKDDLLTTKPIEPEAFEKVVNLKFKQTGGGQQHSTNVTAVQSTVASLTGQQTISFDTKQYYAEANRLAQNPSLYKFQPKNPIYSYVPENFNFQVNSSSVQDFFTNESKKGRQNLRFGKLASSNLVFPPSRDQDSMSQMRDIDYLEECDTESLMKTNSVRLSTQQFKTSQQSLNNANSRQNPSHLNPPKFQHTKSTNYRNGYPHDIFDPQFYSRKQLLKKVPTESEKNLDDKQIFATTFKLEDCPTLKQKLYRTEPLTDPYNPASKNIVRESYPLDNKPPYVTQFKCDPLVNPYGMSDHDSRPKEAIMRDEREKQKKEAEYQKKIDDFMGKQAQTKDWKNYFTLADMDHNFVDQTRPTFLDKGSYLPPSTILGNLLRGDLEPLETPFKLFHRTLHHYDKNLCLGEVGESKF